jgi:hypothetical protein
MRVADLLAWAAAVLTAIVSAAGLAAPGKYRDLAWGWRGRRCSSHFGTESSMGAWQ